MKAVVLAVYHAVWLEAEKTVFRYAANSTLPVWRQVRHVLHDKMKAIEGPVRMQLRRPR